MERLFLKYNDVAVRLACCVTSLEDFHLQAHEVLSHHELEKYDSFKVESGRIEYLLGRCSAKRAYLNLIDKNVAYNEIDIRNGIFEQPYIVGEADFDVSISHSQNIGGAIVFDRAFPMGFDLEVIDEMKVKTIQVSVSDDELEHLNGDYESNITAIWCMKEALSKAIRTGLTIPLDLLKISDVKRDGKFLECHFENFSQYKAIAEIAGTYAMSIIYPQQLIVGDVI